MNHFVYACMGREGRKKGMYQNVRLRIHRERNLKNSFDANKLAKLKKLEAAFGVLQRNSVCSFKTAKLLFGRNNRLLREGLVSKGSTVASHQTN